MLPLWLKDLESLETISQDEYARDVVLRMADLSRAGNLTPFLVELDCDRDLDAATKATFAELARETTFLNAVDDYVHRTRLLH